MDRKTYRECIESLQATLEFEFKERWGLSDGAKDPLNVICDRTARRDVESFGDAAATFVEISIELVERGNFIDHKRHIENVLKLGTFLSMRSTESLALSDFQQDTPVIDGRIGEYSHDARTQRMVVLTACWLALYFLGMRFDFLLAAVKRLAERSQGYPNGFVSVIFLAECIEDYRFDISVQDSPGSIYYVAANNPRLYVPWARQHVVRDRTMFSWERVTRTTNRDWTQFTEYIGWLYYYWQCMLLGSAFQLLRQGGNGHGRKIYYCLDLEGILPDEESKGVDRTPLVLRREERIERLDHVFGSDEVELIPLDRGYAVGAYHARGGFTIGTREGFGSSYDIVARRLEGTLLTEHLNRLKDLERRSKLGAGLTKGK